MLGPAINTTTAIDSKPSYFQSRKGGLPQLFFHSNRPGGAGGQDIYVADDLTPNMLWRNEGDGRFTDVAVAAGCAYSDQGTLLGRRLVDHARSPREPAPLPAVSGQCTVTLAEPAE